MNVESKKLLAKLLAEENITVEFKKTSTAGFDTKSRVLILPILKEGLTDDIVNLFILHEVGHALFTPNDQWIESIKTHNKSIVNILEDVRIERKIQQRYPGSKSNFIKGYDQLNRERDFFKISDIDLTKLNFLNKLNLYTKLGPTLLLDFNPEEFGYVLKSFETESFEDVLNLAKQIENLLKEKQDQDAEDKRQTPEIKKIAEGGDEEITENSDEEIAEEQDDEFDDLGGYSDFDELGEEQDDEFDEFDTSTLDALHENFDSLISDDCKEQKYIDVRVVDSNPFIVSAKEIISRTVRYYNQYYPDKPFSKQYKLYNSFISENSKIIQYLINEFNIHKNAKQLKKERRNKTGNLDIKKLHNYKITDQLFKNIEFVEKEKSHGLVLFLDWSGSMLPYLNDTIKQLLNLLVFCKKLSIPFEVYAFSEQYSQHVNRFESNARVNWTQQTQLGTILSTTNCNLLNFFSSSMPENEFKFMANMLLGLSCYQMLHYDLFDNTTQNNMCDFKIPNFLNLYRTPIDQTIILAMDIVPKFKQAAKVDKVQTIFLTDGEASPSIYVCYDENGSTSEFNSDKLEWRNKQIIFREPKSKLETKAVNRRVTLNRGYRQLDATSTVALFNLLKQKLEDNVISYRIIEPKDLTSGRLNYYFDTNYLEESKMSALKSKLNKEKYLSLENIMHTKSFLVKSSSLSIDDSELKIDSTATTKKMAKTFSENVNKRMTNRLFLTDFIKLIA